MQKSDIQLNDSLLLNFRNSSDFNDAIIVSSKPTASKVAKIFYLDSLPFLFFCAAV